MPAYSSEQPTRHGPNQHWVHPRGCNFTHYSVWFLPKIHNLHICDVKTHQTSPKWGSPQNNWPVIFSNVKSINKSQGRAEDLFPVEREWRQSWEQHVILGGSFFCKGHYRESWQNLNSVFGWRVRRISLYCFCAVLWVWHDLKWKRIENVFSQFLAWSNYYLILLLLGLLLKFFWLHQINWGALYFF